MTMTQQLERVTGLPWNGMITYWCLLPSKQTMVLIWDAVFTLWHLVVRDEQKFTFSGWFRVWEEALEWVMTVPSIRRQFGWCSPQPPRSN